MSPKKVLYAPFYVKGHSTSWMAGGWRDGNRFEQMRYMQETSCEKLLGGGVDTLRSMDLTESVGE